jgi:hypothetical protein
MKSKRVILSLFLRWGTLRKTQSRLTEGVKNRQQAVTTKIKSGPQKRSA